MAKAKKKAATTKAAPAPIVIHLCEMCGMQMKSPADLIPALCPGCAKKQGATADEQGSEEEQPSD